MRKVVFWFLLGVLLLGGGVWFTWQRLSNLTGWEPSAPARVASDSTSGPSEIPGPAPGSFAGETAPTEGAASEESDNVTPGRASQPASARQQLETKVQRKQADLVQTGSVHITPQDIDLAVRAAFEARYPDRAEQILKQVQTIIDPEAVTVTLVLDVTRIPEEDLPGQLRMLTSFMKKTNRKALETFSLQIKGRPEVRNGSLQLNDGARLRMGQFEYPLNDLLRLFTGRARLQLSSVKGLDRVHEVALKPGLLIVR